MDIEREIEKVLSEVYPFHYQQSRHCVYTDRAIRSICPRKEIDEKRRGKRQGDNIYILI